MVQVFLVKHNLFNLQSQSTYRHVQRTTGGALSTNGWLYLKKENKGKRGTK